MSISKLARSKWVPSLSSYSIGFWFTTIILSFLVGIPLLFFMWGSVWTTTPGLPGTFTLRGYEQLTQPIVFETIANTVIIAVGSTIISVLLGIIFLMYSLKTNGYAAWFISIVLIIQYMMPSYINAIAWIYYLGPNGVVNSYLMLLPFINDPVLNVYSMWGIILVSGTHYAGLVFLLTSGGVRAIPVDLENAARMHTSHYEVMRRIIIPLVIPSIAISAVLIAVRMLQTFGIPLILGLPVRIYVLATLMYDAVTTIPYNFKFAGAAGMLLLIVTLLGLYWQRRITGARDKYETLQGSEQFGQRFDLGRYRSPISGAMWSLVLVLYILPFVTVFLASFQRGLFHPLELEFTLQHYEALVFGNWQPALFNAIGDTLVVAVIAATGGMILSTVASYVIVKSDHLMGDILDYIALSSSSIPGIIAGIAFLWIFLSYDPLNIYGTVFVLALAFMGKYIVYGTRAVNSSFRAIGQDLEDAAKVAGGTTIGLFRRIFAPLIKPGFVAGFTIYFIDATKSLSIPLLLSVGETEMIQALLYRLITSSQPALSAAVAVIMIAGISIIYLSVHYFTDVDVTSL